VFISVQIDPGSVAYLDGRLTLWDEVLKVKADSDSKEVTYSITILYVPWIKT